MMVQVATPIGIEVAELLRPGKHGRLLVRLDSTGPRGCLLISEVLILRRARLPRAGRTAG